MDRDLIGETLEQLGIRPSVLSDEDAHVENERMRLLVERIRKDRQLQIILPISKQVGDEHG